MSNKSTMKDQPIRKGIRRNLRTYFSVRLLQGVGFTALFHYYINTFGERTIDWKWTVFTFPAWLVLGTLFLEMLPLLFKTSKSKG